MSAPTIRLVVPAEGLEHFGDETVGIALVEAAVGSAFSVRSTAPDVKIRRSFRMPPPRREGPRRQ